MYQTHLVKCVCWLIGDIVAISFSMTKRRKQNSWFEKAAKEMDIELDEEELYLLQSWHISEFVTL